MNSDLDTSLWCKDMKCMKGAFWQFGSGRNWVVIQLLVIPKASRCCIKVNFTRIWFESIHLWRCLFFLLQGHCSRLRCFGSSPQTFIFFCFSNSLMVQHFAQGRTCLRAGALDWTNNQCKSSTICATDNAKFLTTSNHDPECAHVHADSVNR